jgi:glycosyltransferase involved in cell wall biosynthesis
VLTIHDMIPQIFSREIDPKREDLIIKQRAVEAADAVICDSYNTRKDLLERIKIPENRVTVIHLASELSQEMSFGDESIPDRPYFLFVGVRKAAYKNFARLLQAFARVAEKWTGLGLCVVGPALEPSESKLISELKIDGSVISIGAVTDRHLAKLYRCSVALVYPSLYEGFGIPPLEAMACGSLAVVANTSCLPEVAGASAIKVSPDAVESIADGMLQVLNLNTEQRRLLSVNGMAWASQFNWDKTAKNTIRVYQTLVS